MKKCFQKPFLLVIVLFGTITFLNAQIPDNRKKCCEDETCKTKAKDYATQLANLVTILPEATGDSKADQKALDSVKRVNSSGYKSFMKVALAAHYYFYSVESKFRRDGCFADNVSVNVSKWVAHVGTKAPKFKSAEFEAGLKIRVELGQGSTDIRKNSIGHLGSFRTYLVYTFDKDPNRRDSFHLGNHIRLSVGPAIFSRSNIYYGALSSRIAVRVKDIKPMNFAIGNINLFGEYNTSFGNLSYGAIGAELELGFAGFNISVNDNLKTGRKGFGLNAFYRF